MYNESGPIAIFSLMTHSRPGFPLVNKYLFINRKVFLMLFFCTACVLYIHTKYIFIKLKTSRVICLGHLQTRDIDIISG